MVLFRVPTCSQEVWFRIDRSLLSVNAKANPVRKTRCPVQVILFRRYQDIELEKRKHCENIEERSVSSRLIVKVHDAR